MKNLNALEYGYYSIGENRGKPRIWLQGGNLSRANFEKGVAYDVVYDIDNAKIILKITNSPSSSSRIVSGKRKHDGSYSPIIDLARNSLVDVVNGAQRIRADFYIDQIHISIHHHESKQLNREDRLKKNLKQGVLVKADLCVGIGVSASALKNGLQQGGFKSRTEFVVDRERKYLDVAKANNDAIDEDTTIFEASLEELEPELLGFVDVLNFSLDCSPHSPSGKAKNGHKLAEEHKGALGLVGLIRVIDACQPSILISENVVSAKNSASYLLLKSLLTMTGYNVDEIELDSEKTHSIENRKRWWFVATSAGLPRVSLDNFPVFEREFETLGDLLDVVESSSLMWKSTDEKFRKAEVNKNNGKNFGFNLIDGTVRNIGVCGKFYQKNRASEPHVKGETNETARLLSVKELAKAQSVPSQLVENIVAATAYEGLGQGIDYRQGLGIGLILARDVFSELMGLAVNPVCEISRKISKSLKINDDQFDHLDEENFQIALF